MLNAIEFSEIKAAYGPAVRFSGAAIYVTGELEKSSKY